MSAQMLPGPKENGRETDSLKGVARNIIEFACALSITYLNHEMLYAEMDLGYLPRFLHQLDTRA